jgi:hypothetical protein
MSKFFRNAFMSNITISIKKSNFLKKFCLRWKNANKNVFYHYWGIIPLQQQILIYGCLMEPMMFFLLLFMF